MSYNMKGLPQYINTAGKITVITALFGVVAFAIIFLLNIGATQLKHVEAANGLATTTVTVLNTPPQWTVDARESTPSSTSTPTNSGSTISWKAIATDSNAENYYLLICSASTTPTANNGAAPTCGTGAKRWAVSGSIVSGAQATAATTTTEVAPFFEQNNWVAWVCDSVPVNPRCNATYKQGTGSTSSPFNVNKRPTFTAFWDNSPKLPGTVVTFRATSTDPDIVPINDTVKLIVCATAVFATSTDTCGGITLATSTLVASNPSASYTIPIPMQDTNYPAFGFIVDMHGHESIGVSQGTNSILTVSNATPTITPAQITLNNGANLILTQEAAQTTGFKLRYIVADNNSCKNSASGNEITKNIVSVYRSAIGTTTCNGSSGSFNANNCYGSKAATTTWNLSCTASSSPSDCTGATDTTQTWDCTFPLWYVADPTDGVASNTAFFAQDWRAAVSAIDDNNATSSFTQSSTANIEVQSFLALALNTLSIPYGQLQPGDKTDPLVATTTIRATGNVGIDERLTGKSMCTNFTSAVACRNSATSTVAEKNQVYATSSVTYGFASSSSNRILSSTTPKLLDINVKKSTTTAIQAKGVTYWGIRIPNSITLAGAYTGENTFFGVLSSPSQW